MCEEKVGCRMKESVHTEGPAEVVMKVLVHS